MFVLSMGSSVVGFRFMLILPVGCAAVLLFLGGGCACYQGYLFGRPAAAREFIEMAFELGGL